MLRLSRLMNGEPVPQHSVQVNPLRVVTRQSTDVMQLLNETDFKLRTIASTCGFRHHECMIKVFKQKVGVSPGQFRGTVNSRRDG
jgi:transcriptional regulator GlxA family with amidase domain